MLDRNSEANTDGSRSNSCSQGGGQTEGQVGILGSEMADTELGQRQGRAIEGIAHLGSVPSAPCRPRLHCSIMFALKNQ